MVEEVDRKSAPEELTIAPMYRMPIVFGPAPGPRNVPREREHLRFVKETTAIIVTARTDPDSLAGLLPRSCKLDGVARLEVSISHLTNVGWLAGRGYNIVMVRIPAVFAGEQDAVRGFFVPVLWESLSDPILTGREELGWPKLPAEIPDASREGGKWFASANWQGFRFFEIEAERFVPVTAAPVTAPMFVHKYIPRTGEWGEADVGYVAVSGEEQPSVSCAIERGSGRFSFRPARWEDMPTQYPIVNRLAALPLLEFEGATLMRASGGGDLSSQRIAR